MVDASPWGGGAATGEVTSVEDEKCDSAPVHGSGWDLRKRVWGLQEAGMPM